MALEITFQNNVKIDAHGAYYQAYSRNPRKDLHRKIIRELDGGDTLEENMKVVDKINHRWFLMIAIVLVATGLAVIFSSGFPNSTPQTLLGEDENIEIAPRAGALAPDFELENSNGELIRLSEVKGRPILINFWATWCAPCRLEMPAMQDRFESYRIEGLEVLAVNFDETSEEVREFADELGLTFNLLLDPGGRIQRAYQIRGYPTSYFVDSSGIIRVLHIGVMTEGQLDDYLAEIGLGG
jgi:peroxiredoxin